MPLIPAIYLFICSVTLVLPVVANFISKTRCRHLQNFHLYAELCPELPSYPYSQRASHGVIRICTCLGQMSVFTTKTKAFTTPDCYTNNVCIEMVLLLQQQQLLLFLKSFQRAFRVFLWDSVPIFML